MFEMIMRDVFAKIGGISFVTGLILSINKWLSNVDYSLLTNVLTVLSLLVGIIYFIMRIYHQYIETKRLKRKDKNENQ